MDILLIHPKLTHGPVTYDDRGRIRARLLANAEMTLPAVAAAIPKDHNIRIIHENYEDIDYSKKYDLVGITCFTLFANQVYEIADKFRKLGVPVVLGGYHPTALPKEAKKHADAVVIGEAENSFPQLLNDLESGALKPFYDNGIAKPEDIPPLRRDLLNYKSFIDGIRITRGCPKKCLFCSITYFFNHTYRKRPIKNVINEIKGLSKKHLYIHDANFTSDLKYFKSFFKKIIQEKIKINWFANGNIYNLGNDEDFLQLAKKSGCIGWTTGFESVLQPSLDNVKKSDNIVEKYSKWINKIREHGMAINGLFMFGFDQDTPDVFDKTIDALNQWEIDAAEFNILTPLPGTPLYNQMEKEGRILTKDWSKYTQTEVVFQPKNMTPEELYEGTKKVTREFHKINKMMKRWARLPFLTLNPSAITSCIAMNLSTKIWYKREFDL